MKLYSPHGYGRGIKGKPKGLEVGKWDPKRWRKGETKGQILKFGGKEMSMEVEMGVKWG